MLLHVASQDQGLGIPIWYLARANSWNACKLSLLLLLSLLLFLLSLFLLYRYNQELEEDSAAMEQERLQLQQQAESLAQRLEAVLSDKFVARSAFDADTPIDKTLAFLQDVIKVSPLARYQDDCECRRSLLMLRGN